MSNQPRQSKGQPTGGQFAPRPRTTSGVDLSLPHQSSGTPTGGQFAPRYRSEPSEDAALQESSTTQERPASATAAPVEVVAGDVVDTIDAPEGVDADVMDRLLTGEVTGLGWGPNGGHGRGPRPPRV